MAQGYTPIWDDWLEVTRELNAQEKGRLIDAIVAYKLHGDWQEQIKGNERYVFPTYKVRLDRWNEVSEGRSKAGSIGGKQTQASASKPKQTEANASKSPKVKVKVKEKDIDNDNSARETDYGIVQIDPARIYIQQNLNELTPAHYEELDQYEEILPEDLIKHAVDEAVGNGVRNWTYVRTILQNYVKNNIRTVGEAKARSDQRKKAGQASGKHVTAQQYDQRSYSEDELEEGAGSL